MLTRIGQGRNNNNYYYYNRYYCYNNFHCPQRQERLHVSVWSALCVYPYEPQTGQDQIVNWSMSSC